MSGDGDDYKQHQQNWEAKRDKGYTDKDEWMKNEQANNEEMLAEMEA